MTREFLTLTIFSMVPLANPIYDTVFKFLMEDLDIAKEIISAIIDKEILEISVYPQESSYNLEGKTSFTVYRLDFLALIQTQEGAKKVLIELQKAKFSTDIMRFRRYLGEQYKKDTYPIITIYLLGHEIEKNLPPILVVDRNYRNRITGEIIQIKNEFIERLTHDSYIIQIPLLRSNYQTKLERILSVFEQRNLSEDKRIIYYDLEIKDQTLQKITNRLRYGAGDDRLRKQMEIEEEILSEFENLERKIEKQEAVISQTLQEKEQAIQEKQKAIEEKEQAIQEKQKAIEEKEQALQEKQKAIQELKEQQQKLLEKEELIQKLMEQVKKDQEKDFNKTDFA